MATYNCIVESTGYSPLSCDGCGSNNIQETVQGYVCGECGLVLEIERLQYYRPFNEDVVQYAKLGTTQIGSKKERCYSPYSRKLRNLYRLQTSGFSDTKRRVFYSAKIEIKRILSALDIPESFRELIFINFKKIYCKFLPSTKYRSVERLVPVVLYYSLRDQNIPISIPKLLEVSKIEKGEFNHFRMQVRQYLNHPDFIKRQLFISQKLIEVKEKFHLGMEFVFYARKIMSRLWDMIKNTTDNVIAGVSASITALCYYDEQVSINAICKALGIRMSTIQFQVAHRIFKNLRLKGFTSLKQSTPIIKKVMEQLGCEKDKIQTDSIVVIKLGTAVQVFNHKRDVDHYLFGVLTTNKERIILGLNVYKPMRDIKTSVDIQSGRLFDLELCRYSHGKDPPISSTI